MSFVTCSVRLPEAFVAPGGVVPAELQLRLVDMSVRVDALLERAVAEARAIVGAANAEADEIRACATRDRRDSNDAALAHAESLLEAIGLEWQRIVSTIEPTAIAVAKLALQRICDASTLAERIECATIAAIRELPECPLRIRVSIGSQALLPANITSELEVDESAELTDGQVCVEGEHGACEADFDVALAVVVNLLEGWSTRVAEPGLSARSS